MIRIRTIIENSLKPLSWQWYRDFFALSYLRYMMTWFSIVPILVLFLHKVPQEILITITSPPILLTIDLPFSWQLLWIGSLCFFIAFLVYQTRAPIFVRRYHSLDDYLAKGHSPRWISWEARDLLKQGVDRGKFLQRMKTKGYVITAAGPAPQANPHVGQKTTDFHFSHQGSEYVLAMPILDQNGNENAAATNIAVREIFWEIFGRYADSRFVERLVIKLLLIAAGLCVAVVVLQHIWRTATYLST